jgi:hypothetical protein
MGLGIAKFQPNYVKLCQTHVDKYIYITKYFEVERRNGKLFRWVFGEGSRTFWLATHVSCFEPNPMFG